MSTNQTSTNQHAERIGWRDVADRGRASRPLVTRATSSPTRPDRGRDGGRVPGRSHMIDGATFDKFTRRFPSPYVTAERPPGATPIGRYVTDPGRAGPGRLVAVGHVDPGTGYVGGLRRRPDGDRGSGLALLADVLVAVAESGDVDVVTADCLGDGLARLYARLGFSETLRAPWSEDLKPDGWHYPTADPRPDYIELAYRIGA